MIKAVLFDIGNVIIPWSPEKLFVKIIPDAERRRFFLDQVVPMDWHNNHDAGVTFAENRKGPLERFPEFAGEIMAFDERFEEMLGAVVPETIAVIEELHTRGVPLYALTNMPTEKAELVFSHIPVFSYFRDVVISGVEKIMKPGPEIFDLTLKRIGLPAKDIFFTDDSAANIAMAASKGFVTHLFDQPDTLRPALVAAGVL